MNRNDPPWVDDLGLDWSERRHLVLGFAVVAVFIVLLCLAGGGPS